MLQLNMHSNKYMSTNNLELAQCVQQPYKGVESFSTDKLGGLSCEFYNSLGWHVFILQDPYEPVEEIYRRHEPIWYYMIRLGGMQKLNFAHSRFRTYAKNRVQEIENA